MKYTNQTRSHNSAEFQLTRAKVHPTKWWFTRLERSHPVNIVPLTEHTDAEALAFFNEQVEEYCERWGIKPSDMSSGPGNLPVQGK